MYLRSGSFTLAQVIAPQAASFSKAAVASARLFGLEGVVAPKGSAPRSETAVDPSWVTAGQQRAQPARRLFTIGQTAAPGPRAAVTVASSVFRLEQIILPTAPSATTTADQEAVAQIDAVTAKAVVSASVASAAVLGEASPAETLESDAVTALGPAEITVTE